MIAAVVFFAWILVFLACFTLLNRGP